MAPAKKAIGKQVPIQDRDEVTIRFAGDSGDGMQLAGAQFTSAAALLGNDVRTLPDFPAEIRAPAGTLAGVSGFQVHFSRQGIHTPGDVLTALVAMNPAALRANSVRVSTPNLLSNVEMWNLTVRTVIFSLEAISLFARFDSTE